MRLPRSSVRTEADNGKGGRKKNCKGRKRRSRYGKRKKRRNKKMEK
jgi:hypothetical protein